MKRLATVLAFAFTIGLSSPAWSLGSFGAKAGTGLSIQILENDPGGDYEAPNITPSVFGLSWTMGLLVAELEVDVLYMRTTASGGTPSVPKTTSNSLAFPAIAKVQLPIVPLLVGLQFGAGLELRYNLDDDDEDGIETEKVVTYLPVMIGADFDIQLARATAEIRYEHQLSDSVKGSGDRLHQILFLLGASL